MNIRKMLEEQEMKLLSPYAAFSAKSRGRLHLIPECSLRPAYQQDRDRIVHSKSFRRLKRKTQVFLSPTGDHYRTRLTHTLEVAQIARTIAKSLRLNEDLTEAIALGHDLGHTPFGHAGEAVLNKIHPGGFHHEQQSLRVVDVLEKNGRGLNLTFEVRDGIVNHSKGSKPLFPENNGPQAVTLEGRIVRLADSIAYVNHDVDDAIRGGLIKLEGIPGRCLGVLGETNSGRINTMVCDLIYTSRERLPQLSMSPEVLEAIEELRAFLNSTVYYDERTYREFRKASKVVEELYAYFVRYPAQIGGEFRKRLEQGEETQRLACDFIAGMTDTYALKLYEQIFLPQPWLVM